MIDQRTARDALESWAKDFTRKAVVALDAAWRHGDQFASSLKPLEAAACTAAVMLITLIVLLPSVRKRVDKAVELTLASLCLLFLIAVVLGMPVGEDRMWEGWPHKRPGLTFPPLTTGVSFLGYKGVCFLVHSILQSFPSIKNNLPNFIQKLMHNDSETL